MQWICFITMIKFHNEFYIELIRFMLGANYVLKSSHGLTSLGKTGIKSTHFRDEGTRAERGRALPGHMPSEVAEESLGRSATHWRALTPHGAQTEAAASRPSLGQQEILNHRPRWKLQDTGKIHVLGLLRLAVGSWAS